MYQIQVRTDFEAAHRLPNYPGPCANLHGHHWTVWGTWQVAETGSDGMTLDMTKLKKELRYCLADLDHTFLNKILDKPTAENLAALLFSRLKKRDAGEKLIEVCIEETPGSRIKYTGEESK